MEINAVLNVLVSFLILKITGEYIFHQMKEVSAKIWSSVLSTPIDMNMIMPFTTEIILKLIMILLPLLAAVFLMGVISNVAQVGFMVSFEPLKPSIDRINPAKGFQRLFLSKRIIFEIVKAVVKIVVIVYIFYSAVKKILDDIFLTPLMDVNTYFLFSAAAVYKLGMKLIVAFVIFSILDYLFQKYEFEDNLKMSKQEVKDEMKQMEGDPIIKARIRQVQRELARKRMISEIPQADVVITNPTHIAVALRYKEGVDGAPTVVAKGINLMAEKVKEIARANQVIIVPNPPLARALVKLEVGWEIPNELFQAVAEILAFVYQAKGKIRLEENTKKVDNSILADKYIPNPEIGGS